jgi:hypothetical protein
MRPSVTSRLIPAVAALAVSALCAASAGAVASKRTQPAAEANKVEPRTASGADTANSMRLKGGDEGTVFRTLTVEGEDRIHIEVERPVLRLDVDPEKAPGLDAGTVRDVLDRTTPDLESPLRSSTARDASPWVAHPWLSHFPDGAVARFRPAVTNVARWRLLVVNARAESVAVFQGEGSPPREIAWDGRSTDGSPVLPGASYSYLFEARDKAGNKRNFVGEGFRVNTFRYDTPQGPTLVFAASELERPGGAAWGPDETPPIVIQVASEMNQEPAERRVRIEVTARSAAEANALGGRLMKWMGPHLLGDPARLESVGFVAADAPVGGAVSVSTETP